MVFAHDTEMSLSAAAALVNSTDGGEQLTGLEALDAFVRRWQWTGRPAQTEAELQAVRDLRPRLRRLWEAAGTGAAGSETAETGTAETGTAETGTAGTAVVELVNELLREFRALPQLVRHEPFSWHLHATPDDAPLATRMAVEAAMAFVDLIREDELSRLRVCEFPSCDNVLVDLSKNRSKRFCEAGCGNRAAVSAYRARRRSS